MVYKSWASGGEGGSKGILWRRNEVLSLKSLFMWRDCKTYPWISFKTEKKNQLYVNKGPIFINCRTEGWAPPASCLAGGLPPVDSALISLIANSGLLFSNSPWVLKCGGELEFMFQIFFSSHSHDWRECWSACCLYWGSRRKSVL